MQYCFVDRRTGCWSIAAIVKMRELLIVAIAALSDGDVIIGQGWSRGVGKIELVHCSLETAIGKCVKQ